jgi:sorbose reductase
MVLSDEKLAILRQRGRGAHVEHAIVDVRDENVVESTVSSMAKLFGRLDIVLCFAGMVYTEHSLNVPVAKWHQILDVNTLGCFLVAQSAAREMVRLKESNGREWCEASITFIASISAHFVNMPQPQAAYNVSKAGVVHLAHCLAAEWAVHGIRVNSISPGYMDTVLNEGSKLDEAKKIWMTRLPMGRMGRRDELAGAVVMLASPAGSYITGSDLRIDGKFFVLQFCVNLY